MYDEGVSGGVPSVYTDGQGAGGAGIVGALVGTGAMLYDSHQNRQAAKRNTDRTIEANKAESELAYQRQMEMWGIQNEYNSPAAQMQRFLDAGLNPHLIYGQGNAGNSSSTPQYNPANQEYRYQSMQVAPAITAILPMLMQVGSWMQDMRLKETQIGKTDTDVEKTRQLIEFLQQRNPQLLKEAGYNLAYQPDTLNVNLLQAKTALEDMQQKFRAEYGESLFSNLTRHGKAALGDQGGMQRLKYMEQEAKTRLEQAQASWTDFSVTNPQALMQLVLQGVMGLAGQTLRAKPGAGIPTGIRKGSRRTGERSVTRDHPARRVQSEHQRVTNERIKRANMRDKLIRGNKNYGPD